MSFSDRAQYDEKLKRLYAENDYPLDRLSRNTHAAQGFTSEFARRECVETSTEEVMGRLEYIRKTKRKTGGLPRLGRRWRGPNYLDR